MKVIDVWYHEYFLTNQCMLFTHLETDMDSDSDSQDNNTSEENGSGNLDNDKKEDKDDKKTSALFGMTLVNSYGSADLAKLKDDSNPIKFTSKYFFAVLFRRLLSAAWNGE